MAPKSDFYPQTPALNRKQFRRYLTEFKLHSQSAGTRCSQIALNGKEYPVYSNEFWTRQQRQANPIHEVSYRACFKPQLPRFFIEVFTKPGQLVYDPFNGRGTTVIEAALLGRNVVANDVNPLSLILTQPRIKMPNLGKVEERLNDIPIKKTYRADIDLSMFYHAQTEAELVSLQRYLAKRRKQGNEDNIDRWIRMVATNRLTGHSKGFFSVYTLPPNQAVTQERQKKINKQRKQKPEYRDIRNLILRKSKSLLKAAEAASKAPPVKSNFLNGDAAATKGIKSNSVALTVTSPPFLNIVQYASDNWLRCWFNGIDVTKVEPHITMSRTVEEWSEKMLSVFKELYRITAAGGVVAFEVGEVHHGKTRLEEAVVTVGTQAGFDCDAIIINEQQFTKTSNIWGVKNNRGGTNSNRIVVFRK